VKNYRRKLVRKLITICLAVTVLLAVSATPAFAVITYVDVNNVYTTSEGGVINWLHMGPHSVYPDPPYSVISASLTIIADDVDGAKYDLDGTMLLDGEQDKVWVSGDEGATWHDLGYLQQMPYYTDWNCYPGPGNLNDPNEITTTVFIIDPSWLNTVPVKVKIEPLWEAEIEVSTLTAILVPEPATICLLGLGALSLLRKETLNIS
jgi:hypothetical protein